jgi:hypothetical protein
MIFDSPLVEEKEHASAESRTNEVVPTLPAAPPRHYPERSSRRTRCGAKMAGSTAVPAAGASPLPSRAPARASC